MGIEIELEVSKYRVKGYDKLWIEERKQRDGSYKWAIYNTMGNMCWNKKEQSFVLEPMPSSRSDKFLKETRFVFEEAVKIVKGFFEDPQFVKMAEMLR